MNWRIYVSRLRDGVKSLPHHMWALVKTGFTKAIILLVQLARLTRLNIVGQKLAATSAGQYVLVRWHKAVDIYRKLTSPPPDPLMAAMMMQGVEIDIDEDPTELHGNRLFTIIGAFFVIMVLWAALTELDEVVRAEGTDYGLGLKCSPTANKNIDPNGRAKVPRELEDMPLPLNTYKNKEPFTGKVRSVERIVGPNATGETCHIIIEHGGKMPFWEGQSYGVIPPGTKVNSKGKEVPHGVRLYSIASSRYGDSYDGQTATLCVRRATYWDPEMNAEGPAKKGICSNFLFRISYCIKYWTIKMFLSSFFWRYSSNKFSSII